MKTLYLFVPALMIILCSFALFRKKEEPTPKKLTTVFTKEFTKPGGYPHVVEVIGDENSGFAILSSVIADWGSNTRLSKVDASGNEEWSYDYYADEWKEPEFIKRTRDGYIVGILHVPNRINRTVILMKVDLNGKKVWDREFKKDSIQSFIHFKQDKDNFVLTVKTSNTNSNKRPDKKVSLWDFTLDNNGNLINEKEYPNFETLSEEPRFYSIETADKGFVGYSGVIDPATRAYNMIVHKFGPFNSLRWEKTYVAGEPLHVKEGTSAPNGNFTFSAARFYKSMGKAWFFEVNKNNGDYVWQYQYSSKKMGDTTFAIPEALTYSGGYYASGYLSNHTTRKTQTPFILKLDDKGKLMWDYVIDDNDKYRYANDSDLYVSANKEVYLFGSRNMIGSYIGSIYMKKLRE